MAANLRFVVDCFQESSKHRACLGWSGWDFGVKCATWRCNWSKIFELSCHIDSLAVNLTSWELCWCGLFYGHDLRFLPVDLQPNSRGCGEECLECRLKLVEIVTKDSYIVRERNTGQSPPGLTDTERVGMVRLVQDLVDDVVKQLRCSSASLSYSILYWERRRKLPVNQDGTFCVAVKFFE